MKLGSKNNLKSQVRDLNNRNGSALFGGGGLILKKEVFLTYEGAIGA